MPFMTNARSTQWLQAESRNLYLFDLHLSALFVDQNNDEGFSLTRSKYSHMGIARKKISHEEAKSLYLFQNYIFNWNSLWGDIMTAPQLKFVNIALIVN